MSDMPEEIWAGLGLREVKTPYLKNSYEIEEMNMWCSSKHNALRDDIKYIRADLTGLQCFYDYEGTLPNKFIALYSDGSGCNMFYYSHDDQYGKRMYTSASDNDYIMGVDEGWFLDAGYLWFIALPDDFKVGGEE